MTTADLAGYIQHTEVSATADRARIEQVLSECEAHGFAGAMVQPCWVPLAAARLADTDSSVCTALGYPLGGDRTLSKVTGIRDAVAAGADEIDVMANIGWLKSGDDDAFRRELDALVDAAGNATIKLMLELGGLTDAEAEREIEYAVDAGFDYLKNSSGFGVGGQATVDRIRFIADRVDGSVGVKASGGIKTGSDAQALLDAGADLLGASSGVEIVSGDAGAAEEDGGDGY
ncbi:deoxyribose-phosphate aldolase [Halobellus salinus]|uniref:Deoxyribose-phosphate aldolase n=1 Tax=Halobellus salinus TaxID=931585 RepID=A0A830EP73_9EURY|nr:deoxyribose-phosphate aldolase [Halobellus salinus]GGJ10218.1 deoxyribose-phosphate aldolase [Halobellus salinus]SMP24455.1 deoxyribose-phosphate aldolase [Halobellus salinus]